MQDHVKAEDYHNYLTLYCLPKWLAKQKEVKERYAKCKEEYDGSFMARLFKNTYENSWKGTVGFMGEWDFYEGRILDIMDEITRVKYLMKTNTEKVQMLDVIVPKKFYAWCYENNIPY